MSRFAIVAVPALFAVRQMRARPLPVAIALLAVGAACALIGWSSLAAALSQEENVRLRLREVPPDGRSLQVVYHLQPFESDDRAGVVARFFGSFEDLTGPRRRLRVWQPVGGGIRLAVAGNPAGDVTLTEGRLPAGCRERACEAVALTGGFRLGERVALGRRTVAVVVGLGVPRRDALPSEPAALAGVPDLGERGLLVRSLEAPLAELLAGSGSTVVETAALEPDALGGSELRHAIERLRRGIVRLERTGPLIEATGPLALLAEVANRGEVARDRLFLIAGQGAALIVAFAAFAARARRREARLRDQQLATLGASDGQIRTARIVEAALPSLVGAALALGGLRLAALVLAERRGLAASFASSALPFETLLTIVGVAAAGAVLLVVSITPRRLSRHGIGVPEVAAVTALGFVVWQATTTGALDPQRVAAGAGTGPVLLLLPALSLFTAGVLLLRLLPLALHLAERLARRGPLGVRLAVLTAARSPAQAAAATTFLAVALGGALFSLDYEATLERQARDEGRFAAGARWRVVERSAHPDVVAADVTPLSRFAAVASERPTPVLRLDARLRERFAGSVPLDVEVLAVPAPRIPDLLGWRDDFSRLSRSEIARRLRPRPLRLTGLSLDHEATALRVWARARKAQPRLAVLHFLRRNEQRFAQIRLGVATRGWRLLSAPLPRALRGAELVGVEFVPTFVPPNGALDPSGFVELGRFEERRGRAWSPLPSLDGWAAGMPGEALSSQGSLLLAEFGPRAPVRRGVHFDLNGTVLPLIRPDLSLPEALPALAGDHVAAAAVDGTVTLDVLGQKLPLRVAARARLFPTVVEKPSQFVVVDYETLFAALNLDRPGLARPSEAWFLAPQSPDFAARLARPPFRLERAVGVEPLTARLLSDPLAVGSRDVLLVAAVVAAALGLFGLVLFVRSALTSERPVHAEYEALGVPPSVLVRSAQFRLVLLLAVGLAAALLGGLLAVRLIGAFVAVAGTAARPLPPIEAEVAWGAAVAVLGTVVALAVGAVFFLAGREFRRTPGRRLRA